MHCWEILPTPTPPPLIFQEKCYILCYIVTLHKSSRQGVESLGLMRQSPPQEDKLPLGSNVGILVSFFSYFCIPDSSPRVQSPGFMGELNELTLIRY